MFKLLGRVIRLSIPAFLLVAGGSAVPWLGWPDRTAFFVAAAVVAAWFGPGWLIRERRARREEERAVAAGFAGRMRAETNPYDAANAGLAWRSGKNLLKASRGADALPWYLSMGGDNADRAKTMRLVEISGAQPEEDGFHPDFFWHFAKNAIWLDLDSAMLGDAGDGRWRLFLEGLVENLGNGSLAGIVYSLDAGFLMEADSLAIEKEAARLRVRLDQLTRASGVRIPVYILVDRVDSLYGMRSLAAGLSSAELDEPLGGIRFDARESPGEFAARIVGTANAVLAAGRRNRESGRFPRSEIAGGCGIEPETAASLRALEETRRLETPLVQFCREAFADNPYQMIAPLRGIFLAASAPGETPVSLVARSGPAFHPLDEATPPARPWFLGGLLAERIPFDPAPVEWVRRRAHRRAVAANAGLAAFMAGSLALCWLMTLAFMESLSVIDGAGKAAAAPLTEESLRSYLESTLELSRRNDAWRLPRFGMDEPEALAAEMRRRYLDAYCDLKALPNIERLGKRVAAAVRSRDATDIGDALLAATLMRRGLASVTDSDGADFAAPGRTPELFDGARPPHSDEWTQLEMYLNWADGETWMPQAVETLAALERFAVDNAMDGDVMKWLPDWVDGTSGLAAMDVSIPVWIAADVSASRRRPWIVRPAWTAAGFERARDLLGAIACRSGDEAYWSARREGILDAYRSAALEKWREIVRDMWRDFPAAIDDAEIDALLERAADGDDPASRMRGLLRKHLLPMYPEDSPIPEIIWLRESARLHAAPAGRPDGASQETGALSRFSAVMAEFAGRSGPYEGNAPPPGTPLPHGKSPPAGADGVEKMLASFKEIARLSAARETSVNGMRREHLKFMGAAAASLPAVFIDGGSAPGRAPEPFDEAGKAALELDSRLSRTSRSDAWRNVSPTASYGYICHLATRRAALHLDAIWRETVFGAASAIAGAADDGYAQLNRISGPLDAFLGTASLGLWRVDEGRLANSLWNGRPFMFNTDFFDFVERVVAMGKNPWRGAMRLPFRVESVNVGAMARERPVRVDFIWNEKGAEQRLSYRNYAVDNVFEWHMDRSATARIVIEFPSLTIAKEFSGDSAIGDFVRAFDSGECVLGREDFPSAADALARLGIGGISIRVDMRNGEEFRGLFANRRLVVPYSIITPGGGRSADGGRGERTAPPAAVSLFPPFDGGASVLARDDAPRPVRAMAGFDAERP